MYNGDPRIQETHNCWSYAMNVVDPAQVNQCAGKKGCTPRYHQPGGTQGLSKELHSAEGRSCPTVEKLMYADVPTLKKIGFRSRCPAGTSKIALVVHPDEDYHFYREDPDGLWSHKDGSNKAKRVDADGLPIVNPQTAARDYRSHGSFLNYTDFCGFYCAPRAEPVHLARGGRRKTRRASYPIHRKRSEDLSSDPRQTIHRVQHSQRLRRAPASRRIKLR